MASMVLTYSWSQLIDMPLFTVCIAILVDIQRLISAFSIQTDEVPMLCTEVFCIGRCYLLLRKDFAWWVIQSANQLVRLSVNQSVRLSVSQSACQWASQPISQSVSQPVNQSANQPISQSASQPVSQPATQSVSQSVNQSANQSVHPSVSQSVACWCISMIT
jgi:hypothetical protein